MAKILNELLQKNDIGDLSCPIATFEDSYIPIIIQSYELDALAHYKTLSDLPLVLVVGLNWSNIRTKAVDFAESLFLRRPYKTWTWTSKTPDWAHLGKVVHGVAVDL